VETYSPGLKATLVAPVVTHLRVLLVPEAMLAGVAVKLLMTGRPAVSSAATTGVVPVPVALAASMNVAADFGASDADRKLEVGLDAAGVMTMFAAPTVDQLNVLLDPGVMVESVAAKEVMVGIEFSAVAENGDPQPAKPAPTDTKRTKAQRPTAETLRCLSEKNKFFESIRNPSHFPDPARFTPSQGDVGDNA
jgi:hypothetical protein